MEPVSTAALVGSGISAIAGFFGARSRNKTDQREAEKNRRFQERMRSTEWQAAVADMEAAGINPAVAYSQGPASSPGGSTPGPALDAVSSAFQAKQMEQSIRLLESQADKSRAEASSAWEDNRMKRARNAWWLNLEGDQDKANLRQLLEAELETAKGGARQSTIGATRLKYLTDITGLKGEAAERALPQLERILDIILKRSGN